MLSASKFLAVAVSTGFLAVAVSDANAFDRSGGGTGPRGNSYTSSGSGSCSNGTCSSSQSVTGPRGGTAVRNNSGSCSGSSCTVNHSGTGPNGRTYTRSNTISR